VPNPSELRRNRLLDGLGDGDFTRLRANLKNVRLTRGEVLHPVGVPIKHVYFPESGMVSMLTVMKSGELIETAIVGREGVAGGWVAIDGRNANTQSTVQIEGSAWQIPTAKFLEINKASDSFQPAIKGVILFQAQQSAACHAIHSIESRMCRWLLLSQDVTGSDQIPLTQEFLSHMLGVPKIIGVAVRAHFAENGPDPVRARQNKNPRPQGSRRMRMRMLLGHPRVHCQRNPALSGEQIRREAWFSNLQATERVHDTLLFSPGKRPNSA
jgi:CRP-like cAMP-binding protein